MVCGPNSGPLPLPVLTNKVLLERDHTHFFSLLPLSDYNGRVAELRQRVHRLQSLEYLLSDLLRGEKKSANPRPVSWPGWFYAVTQKRFPPQMSFPRSGLSRPPCQCKAAPCHKPYHLYSCP